MKGKIRPENKYKKLRANMIEEFRKSPSVSSSFYLFFKYNESINNIIFNVSDKDGNIDWEKRTPVHVLYHVLRIAEKGVRWRDLENFANYAFGSYDSSEKERQRCLVECFAVLYSINLIDYYVDQPILNPSSSIVVFIKEDNDWK
jgi:hypothetical protein